MSDAEKYVKRGYAPGNYCCICRTAKRNLSMKFCRNDITGTKIEMEIHEHASLDEVLEVFQAFLRACGYVIEYDKRLDIVEIDK